MTHKIKFSQTPEIQYVESHDNLYCLNLPVAWAYEAQE
jgi:hypothetical protein